MKRSEINRAIRRMEDMIRSCGLKLPPFAVWTPADWVQAGSEYDEIRDNMLGWDITDFGSGEFGKIGFALFTLRNGNQQDKRYTKPYAEKYLYLEEGQICPMHFHWYKMEDIINRGGGNVLITVYNSTPEGEKAETDVTVHKDGRTYTVPAGTQVRLTPGESITVTQGLYHDFHVEPGHGPVLLGEVSMCNDDEHDNRFYDPVGRFPAIMEDEAPYHLLCNEYPLR